MFLLKLNPIEPPWYGPVCPVVWEGWRREASPYPDQYAARSACRRFVRFRGKRGHLIKILWHDGIGMSLYAKRLERGRFIWPSPADGMVAITAAQLAYMLDGIDWRNPVRTWRPEMAG